MRTSLFACVALAGLAAGAGAQNATPGGMDAAVAQLRHAVGEWAVVTEFLNDDGSVQRSAAGTYAFAWVIEDRVLSGRSDIPEAQLASGILFYVNEQSGTIEMVSVGADGHRWVMTGKAGEEVRYSQEFDTAGGKAQLRFTRSNVEPDRFESRMEWSEDGGKTWKPGNRQVFTRRK